MESVAPQPASLHCKRRALMIALQRLKSLPIALNVMSASKELRATVLADCVGFLNVHVPHKYADISEQQTKEFASWLRRYGHLAGSLYIEGSEAWESWQDMEAKLVEALQEAAAAPAGLHMQEFYVEAITTQAAASLLETLPPAKLEKLHMVLYAGDAVIARINNALGRLTNLRSLSMKACEREGDDYTTCLYVTGLSSLTQLTYLNLECVETGEVLRHLPDSIVELYLTRSVYSPDSDRWLLGHLTKVTCLISHDFDEEVGYHVGDVLPPHLIELSAWDIQHAQVLLPLKKLQKLLLTEMQMPAEEMQQLSSLTALTDVELKYCGSDRIQKAAAGWSALRGLHTLELSFAPGYCNVLMELTSTVTDGLGKLSWLTKLELNDLSIPHESIAQDLARGLSGLVGLQDLSLNTSGSHQQQQSWEPTVSVVLMSAIACLQSLARLRVVGLCMTPTAAVSLATSTSITKLFLDDCNVNDTMISTLKLRMQQLASLSAPGAIEWDSESNSESDSALDSTLDSELESAVDSALDSAVDSELDSAVESDLDSAGPSTT